MLKYKTNIETRQTNLQFKMTKTCLYQYHPNWTFSSPPFPLFVSFSHPHRKHTCITHGPAQTISTHGSCTRLNGRQWWQQAQLLWKERHTCFTQVFDRKRKKTPKSHQVTKNLSENHPQISWRKKKKFSEQHTLSETKNHGNLAGLSLIRALFPGGGYNPCKLSRWAGWSHRAGGQKMYMFSLGPDFFFWL